MLHHGRIVAVKVDGIETLTWMRSLLDQRQLKLLELILLRTHEQVLTHFPNAASFKIHRFVILGLLRAFPETIIPIDLLGHLLSLDVFSSIVSLRRRQATSGKSGTQLTHIFHVILSLPLRYGLLFLQNAVNFENVWILSVLAIHMVLQLSPIKFPLHHRILGAHVLQALQELHILRFDFLQLLSTGIFDVFRLGLGVFVVIGYSAEVRLIRQIDHFLIE